MEILKSNAFLIILFVISLASLIGVIALIISTKKQSERYKKMLEKLGNGKNIENDIMAYVEKVESVSKQNDEIINYCQNIDNNIRNCIQKIGMVRYNAFQDTGSNLSFAVALLDDKNKVENIIKAQKQNIDKNACSKICEFIIDEIRKYSK